jgi:hypothetical protein
MLLWLLIILLIFAVVGVPWGYPSYGYWSVSPLVAIVLIILVLWVLGAFR